MFVKLCIGMNLQCKCAGPPQSVLNIERQTHACQRHHPFDLNYGKRALCTRAWWDNGKPHTSEYIGRIRLLKHQQENWLHH